MDDPFWASWPIASPTLDASFTNALDWQPDFGLPYNIDNFSANSLSNSESTDPGTGLFDEMRIVPQNSVVEDQSPISLPCKQLIQLAHLIPLNDTTMEPGPSRSSIPKPNFVLCPGCGKQFSIGGLK